MRKIYPLFIFVHSLILLLSALGSHAQEVSYITGTVKDSIGNPLPSVTITVKGAKANAVTDENGNFRIRANTGVTLIFSSVGYSKQEMVADRVSVSIILNQSSGILNEVVVTGLGENRAKRNLGYAVTQVSGDDIRRANVINPIAALQGMVPGMQVNTGIGGPQATTRFLIRGSSSLNPYGNTPLIVIDNIIMDDDVVLPFRGGDQDFGNILKDLNPDDIESISVLKGGAVTALYGSKAANGVILIKTKKGFSQKGLGVALSQTFMFDKAYKTIDFQNRFGSGVGEDDWTIGPDGELQVDQNTYGISFGPEMTGQTFRDINGELTKNTPNKNYILGLYQTGVTSNTNVAINGGNEKTTFRGSYSRLTSKSITPNNELERNSYTLRATHRLARRVLLDANVSFARSNTLNPAFQNGNSIIYNYAYNAPRNYNTDYWLNNYIAPEGGINRTDPYLVDNIFWLIYQNRYEQKEDNFRGGITLQANITDWLRLDASGSFNNLQSSYEAKIRGQGEGFSGGDYQTSLATVNNNRFTGSLNFIKKIRDFDFLVQAGADLNASRLKRLNSYRDRTSGQMILPDVYRLSNLTKITVEESGPNRTQLPSLFFQINSTYHNFLSLNIYGRNDWNSTLVYNDGHGNYSYFYPGADASFVFTDAFHLPKFFDFGKLRVSYAEVGNGTDPYTTNTGAYASMTPYGPGGVLRYGYQNNSLPNQGLLPERTKKLEAGVELKMLGNRLGADITVYQQDTKNQIISFGVPGESGVGTALINGGEVRNKGIELQLYGTPIKSNKFSWDVMFNYTRNRNTILSLPFGLTSVTLEGNDGIRSVAFVNGDYGTIVAQYAQASYQAVDADGKPVSSPLNGMPVVSFNTSGITGEPMVLYRRASSYNPTVGGNTEPVVGSILPKFLGSLRNTFNYGRLSFSFFLDSKFGGDVYSTSLFYGTQTGNITASLPGRTADLGGIQYTDGAGNTRNDGILHNGVFRPGSIVPADQSADGEEHDVSGMTTTEAYDKGYIKPTGAADYYLYQYGWGNGIRTLGMVKSSWVSVRQVSLSYDLPGAWTKKLKLNSLRASLLANNLMFLYNSAPFHLNPDNLNTSSSGGFVESGGVPYVRSFGFSLNTSF